MVPKYARVLMLGASRLLTPAQFAQRLRVCVSQRSLTEIDICRALDLPKSVLQSEVTRGLDALSTVAGWFMCPGDEGWPTPMQSSVLRGVGHLPLGPKVAIVGARRADPKGLEAAMRVSRAAVSAGYAVVSGGALGIDTAAHKATVEAGGSGILVFGSGLMRPSPRRNHTLFSHVKAQGAWLSPFPCEAPPAPWRFPVRNEWIAALSDITVVIQASEKSGSLYTARAALRMGRPVYCVPGNMDDPLHRGCHLLLSEGGKVMLSADHCFSQHRASPQGMRLEMGPADDFKRSLWRAASGEPASLSVLVHRIGSTVSEAASAAVELEMSGWLMRHPSGGYTRGQPSQKLH